MQTNSMVRAGGNVIKPTNYNDIFVYEDVRCKSNHSELHL